MLCSQKSTTETHFAQIISVKNFTSHFHKLYFNIAITSKPKFSTWPLPYRLSMRLESTSCFLPACHISRLYHIYHRYIRLINNVCISSLYNFFHTFLLHLSSSVQFSQNPFKRRLSVIDFRWYLCGLVVRDQSFGLTYCLHLQSWISTS
jgi:hypothetical protein